MSDEFSLDKSAWYNKTGLTRVSKWIKDDTESVTHYAKALLAHPYDAETDKRICNAETALTEALLAMKLAKNAYQHKRPVAAAMQAAE